MGILNMLFGLSSESGDESSASDLTSDLGINEATGLPLIPGSCGSIDVAGNPRGTDLSESFGANSLNESGFIHDEIHDHVVSTCDTEWLSDSSSTGCGIDDFTDSGFSGFDSDW